MSLFFIAIVLLEFLEPLPKKKLKNGWRHTSRPFPVTFALPAGEFSLNCADDLQLGECWGRTDSRWDGSEKSYF